MRVTPRKDEVKAVVALLEDDGYETADALAKDIIKKVGELFAKRDWYAWVWRENPEAFQLAFGPVSSESEANKLMKKVGAGLKGQHMVLHLYSTTALLEAHGSLPTSVFCAECDHPQHCHETPRYSPRCWVKGCYCKKYVPVAQSVQL